MRKRLHPFKPSQVAARSSIGGSRPNVQKTSESLQQEAIPFVASKIYASPALQMYDDTDPRYDGKSDQVENVYLPAPVPQTDFIGKLAQWWRSGKW